MKTISLVLILFVVIYILYYIIDINRKIKNINKTYNIGDKLIEHIYFSPFEIKKYKTTIINKKGRWFRIEYEDKSYEDITSDDILERNIKKN